MAHGLNPGQLLVRIDGPKTTVVLTPSVALFPKFDANRDGRLSRAEVSADRQAMLAHLLSGLTIVDEHGRRPTIELADINPPHAHNDPSGVGQTYVRATLHYRFTQPPTSIAVHYGHGAIAPLDARVIRRRSSSDRRSVQARARFDKRRSSHAFFAESRVTP